MFRFIFGHFNTKNPLFGNQGTTILNYTNLTSNDSDIFIEDLEEDLKNNPNDNQDYYLGTNFDLLSKLSSFMIDNPNYQSKTTLVYDNGWKFFGVKWDNYKDVKENMTKDIEKGMI